MTSLMSILYLAFKKIQTIKFKMFKLRNIALIAFGIVFSSTVMAGDVEDGDTALSRKDYATKLYKLKTAATRNEVNAQESIGAMYATGLGVRQ